MPETAFYLYCFARMGNLPVLDGTGVDGEHPLVVRRFGEIAAVLSTVSLADFCGPEAEARMEDISWLGVRAFRHEAAIEYVMKHTPVFPARFGTIFSSLEKVESMVAEYRETIARFLDRMVEHEEWGVKGVLKREIALRELQSRYQAGTDFASLPPGLRYLQEQKARIAVEKELHIWLEKTCETVANDLRSSAAEMKIRKVLSSADSESDSEVVLNWAFLVPRSARGDLRERVERASAELANQGLHFELTGPWPPYNFTPQLVD
ncbi:MAG: GvpL/GvpF family gas vesicle protein [Blastocatellia bacterium]|nr:GvpL/GvpF family gas vesicle protein [Blastocatellia bacterium]